MMTKKKKDSFNLDMVSVRLVKDSKLMSETQIKTPQQAIGVVGDMLCQMDREVLCAINLTTKGTPINCSIVSIGSISSSIVVPREIFKASILSNAAQMIILHNHPSQELTPSREDIDITDTLIRAGSLIGIPLLDHIIVGGSNEHFYSFRANDMIRNPGFSKVNRAEDLYFERKPEQALVREPGESYLKHIRDQSQGSMSFLRSSREIDR